MNSTLQSPPPPSAAPATGGVGYHYISTALRSTPTASSAPNLFTGARVSGIGAGLQLPRQPPPPQQQRPASFSFSATPTRPLMTALVQSADVTNASVHSASSPPIAARDVAELVRQLAESRQVARQLQQRMHMLESSSALMAGGDSAMSGGSAAHGGQHGSTAQPSPTLDVQGASDVAGRGAHPARRTSSAPDKPSQPALSSLKATARQLRRRAPRSQSALDSASSAATSSRDASASSTSSLPSTSPPSTLTASLPSSRTASSEGDDAAVQPRRRRASRHLRAVQRRAHRQPQQPAGEGEHRGRRKSAPLQPHRHRGDGKAAAAAASSPAVDTSTSIKQRHHSSRGGASAAASHAHRHHPLPSAEDAQTQQDPRVRDHQPHRRTHSTAAAAADAADQLPVSSKTSSHAWQRRYYKLLTRYTDETARHDADLADIHAMIECITWEQDRARRRQRRQRKAAEGAHAPELPPKTRAPHEAALHGAPPAPTPSQHGSTHRDGRPASVPVTAKTADIANHVTPSEGAGSAQNTVDCSLDGSARRVADAATAVTPLPPPSAPSATALQEVASLRSEADAWRQRCLALLYHQYQHQSQPPQLAPAQAASAHSSVCPSSVASVHDASIAPLPPRPSASPQPSHAVAPLPLPTPPPPASRRVDVMQHVSSTDASALDAATPVPRTPPAETAWPARSPHPLPSAVDLLAAERAHPYALPRQSSGAAVASKPAMPDATPRFAPPSPPVRRGWTPAQPPALFVGVPGFDPRRPAWSSPTGSPAKLLPTQAAPGDPMFDDPRGSAAATAWVSGAPAAANSSRARGPEGSTPAWTASVELQQALPSGALTVGASGHTAQLSASAPATTNTTAAAAASLLYPVAESLSRVGPASAAAAEAAVAREQLERDIRRHDQLLAAIGKLQRTAAAHSTRPGL